MSFSLCHSFQVLCIWQDPYWNRLLWYCVDNNSYQGCTLPERHEEPLEDPNLLNYEEGDWNQDAYQAVNHEGEISQPTTEGDWNQDTFLPEIPKPCKDEDEWSDGWR